MHPDLETLRDLKAPTYADPADAPTPEPRRRVTVLRLMVYVASSALAFRFGSPAVGTAMAVSSGIFLFAPWSSPWLRLELGAAIGWLSGVVVAVSDMVDILEAAGFFLAAVVLGLAWVIRLLVQIRTARSRRGLASLLIVPAAIALGYLVASGDRLVLSARLATSEAALLAAARDVPDGRSVGSYSQDRWIGLMAVRTIERRGPVALFNLGSGFLDVQGVAYIPGSPPAPAPGWPEFTFEHLRGNWWRYVQSW